MNNDDDIPVREMISGFLFSLALLAILYFGPFLLP
jgi:formate/nitrite transporter FocA (FNT family)